MTDRSTTGPALDNAGVVHEESDVNVRAIFAVAFGLAVTVVVVLFAMGGLFTFFSAREARRAQREYPLATTDVQFPREPRIQPRPAEDLKTLRQREDAILSTYGW